MSDRIAIFDDILPCPEVLQHDLVAARNIGLENDAAHGLTGPEVGERHGDIVGRIDLDVFHQKLK